MHTSLTTILTLLLGLATCGADGGLERQSWLTYTGAWFDVQYPPNFSVLPLKKSSSAANGYDGVKFVEKKEGVEFYVYSPQWSGHEEDYAKEITVNPATEKLDRDSTSAKDYVVGGKVVETNATVTRLITIAAKDASYKRDYEVTTDQVQSSRLIFGFRYPNQRTYNIYKPSYEKFRLSLVRYAD